MPAMTYCRLLFICCVIYSAPSAAKKCGVHKRPVVERPVTKDQSQDITPSPAQQCGVLEIPVECIDKCQTCEYINSDCTQGAVCTPGCDCIPGFVRNENMQCIPEALCPD